MMIFLAGVIIAGYYFLLLPQQNQDKVTNAIFDKSSFGWKFPVAKFSLTASVALAYSNIRNPESTPQELPVRLQIPIIGVDSAIEDALITSDGRMDVPAGSENVAWFALGPHPGQVGSAVIGGHFGISNGIPSVFYNLDKLKVGDKVYVINDEGDTLAFQVRSTSLFDRNADATTVFTSNDGLAHLNLITCEGIWNQVDGNYPERLVVFTDAIPAEGTVVVKAPALPVFYRSLRIGARGADVVALQNTLQQKGFLSFSSGMADGLFGAITRAAVAKYQTSVGLPPDGVFGPLTEAKITSELAVVNAQSPAAESKLPATGIATPESLSWSQTLIQSLKDLYATPTDGIITSLLLLSIVFTIFKIILLL
jgi:LPXTG-site transpeptidase (sortase) family protein